ncbi:kinase-like domain-containing protein [Russula aff. rugulosa BPL654]|nr:kinase-like domain-containing protein [Russula aff. rugulosa BPL654]
MFTSWLKRKARLGTLLQSNGDEDQDGLALDRILHGQSVIAKTAKTIEVDKLRFTDKDLSVIGTLEYGQFSIIDVVSCNVDGRVYVRKSIEKRFAFKTRDQCNPQLERDILLRALRTDSVWAPHLLCAFQSSTHLNLVMDYIEGGTLWDVLESTPLERIREVDLRWWLPQVISAIAWCHSQGFVHRDVKPHNFVLDRTAHVRLIDFGSAAPLAPGSRLVPPEYCRVPCGTCDYISPEILQAHESALVAMEMSDDEADEGEMNMSEGGYGVETDWWSTGAMIYEMAYGVAPFFARDIRSTYLKIIDFRTSLTFQMNVSVSTELQDFLTHLLTDAQVRLGRHGTKEVMQHPFFDGTRWETLHSEHYPSDLHLPQFTYNGDLPGEGEPHLPDPHQEQQTNSPFDFSALFQPSDDGSSPAISVLRTTPRSILRQDAESFFVGFSWGPLVGAFPDLPPITTTTPAAAPLPPALSYHQTQVPQTPTPAALRSSSELTTPMRGGIGIISCASTLRRSRTAPRRRPVSDREAMRQLVDCIGLSARKKVLAAGRTPRGSTLGPSRIKSLRFATEPPEPLDFSEPWPAEAARYSPSAGTGAWRDDDSSKLDGTAVFAFDAGGGDESDGASASDAPPSPSPSPRPGSAMSMLSRRSTTPTGSLLMRLPPPNDTRGAATARQLQHSLREAPMTPSSSSSVQPSINMRAADDGSEDALVVLEERHRALMGEIASIEGRVGAMKRWTG